MFRPNKFDDGNKMVGVLFIVGRQHYIIDRSREVNGEKSTMVHPINKFENYPGVKNVLKVEYILNIGFNPYHYIY